MIIRYLAVLDDAPLAFVILIAAFGASLLVGLVLHEFAHAYVADSLGDRTPRSHGRLSLNPKRHLDPLGAALIFFAGFGWARPVPVNPFNTSGNVKLNMAAIAIAGPVTNLIVAAIAGLPIKLGWVPFFHPFVAGTLGEFAVRGAQVDGVARKPARPVPRYDRVPERAPRDLQPRAAGAARWLPCRRWACCRARSPRSSRGWSRGAPASCMVLIFLPFLGGPAWLFDAMGPPRNLLLELFAGDTAAQLF